MALTLVTGPAEEPLSLEEVKDHLRIDGSDSDAILNGLIIAARTWVENETNRKLVSQTWKYIVDKFPVEIDLPHPPVTSVSSINYINDQGVSTLLAASGYQVDTDSLLARIKPAYGESWPNTRPVYNAVTVEFVCGYSGSEDVPPQLKQAMLLFIGHLYENREATTELKLNEVPMGIKAVLGHYVVRRVNS